MNSRSAAKKMRAAAKPAQKRAPRKKAKALAKVTRFPTAKVAKKPLPAAKKAAHPPPPAHTSAPAARKSEPPAPTARKSSRATLLVA